MSLKRSRPEELDLGGLDTKTEFLLVKIPEMVYNRWENAADEEFLGDFTVKTVSRGALMPPMRTMEINLKPNPDAKDYTSSVNNFMLDEQSKGPPIVAFDYCDETNKFAAVGKATRKLQLRPKEDDPIYHKSVLERSIAASTNKPIEEMPPDHMNQHMTSMEVAFIPPTHTVKKKQAEDLARRNKAMGNVDSAKLKKRVFGEFAGAEHLTLKDLVARCEAPEKELKEFLGKYAVFNKSGRFKQYYELRPEYKAGPKPDE